MEEFCFYLLISCEQSLKTDWRNPKSLHSSAVRVVYKHQQLYPSCSETVKYFYSNVHLSKLITLSLACSLQRKLCVSWMVPILWSNPAGMDGIINPLFLLTLQRCLCFQRCVGPKDCMSATQQTCLYTFHDHKKAAANKYLMTSSGYSGTLGHNNIWTRALMVIIKHLYVLYLASKHSTKHANIQQNFFLNLDFLFVLLDLHNLFSNGCLPSILQFQSNVYICS